MLNLEVHMELFLIAVVHSFNHQIQMLLQEQLLFVKEARYIMKHLMLPA